jgi:SNF2 family DNA or RNA helicase
MIRVLDNTLVVQTDNPGQLRAVFPQLKEAVIQGRSSVAVPFTLESAQVLNNLGFKAPSPIRYHYSFSGRFRPYAHQIHTAEFLTLNRRSFTLNGMGTGKTLSTLWAADYLQQTKKIRRTLIVAPLSTLEPTWGNEIFCNFPLKRYAILHGTRTKRHELLATDQDIYIINHDGVEVVSEALSHRPDIDLFILDELSCYRNQRTTRWKVMNSLVNKCGCDRAVWGLTGAPTPNEHTDAYAQSKLVCPQNYKGHFTTFKHETMYQVTQFKWAPRKGAEDVVSRALRPSIRYALRDCVDLPETTYSDRQVQLSAEQLKHYKQLLNTAVTEVNGSAVTAVNAGVLLSKLIQTACGVLYGADGDLLKIDYAPRLSVIKELIEECEQKVIVFIPFTGALNTIAAELRKHWTVDVVDGSTSTTQRNRIFSAFQRTPNPRVLVANAAAMSHGLTLTEASMIIWYAPSTSNDVYNQANARIVRPGQKNHTNVVHIYGTPEERKIYVGLKEKSRLQDIVLEFAKK